MNVAIIGVGLIGGSVGLAARERLGATVRGHDPAPGVLDAAMARGAIDVACATLADACAEAEIVVVAAPVGALPAAVAAALDAAPPDAAVTDVGSTKRAVAAAIRDERFVGGHPLAGAETAGVEHARADLFDGATWYLTPTEGTAGAHYERLHRAVAGVGAVPVAIDPETHDRVMANVSHLPHVLANVLVSQAARTLSDDGQRLPAIGPSFRDATRVAGANSAIWTDIYLSNREALLAQLDALTARLGAVRAALEAGDASAVEAWNEEAAGDRRALLEAGLAGGAVRQLRVVIPNQPGVVAQIALALGREGINIIDMGLDPAGDNRSGAMTVWVAGDDNAARAGELVSALGFAVAKA